MKDEHSEIAIVGIGCNFPGGKPIKLKTFSYTIILCTRHSASKIFFIYTLLFVHTPEIFLLQVRGLTISGMFCLRERTVLCQYHLRGLTRASGMIKMTIRQENHEQQKLHLQMGKSYSLAKRCILF